ncbi:aminotransferase class I/II-fold pyridoxal phosphate-dependent enzyme [Bacillus solimangrovi]|nr:aminotransferase class I/II-fold pyridoxal phosphate-dependent enzyme [Bacillus solimangrovi]
MEIRLPIYEALVNHINHNPTSLHVPGHKYGSLFVEDALETFEKILSIDATEITGLDDLHAPSGVIKEAEILTAQLYGVKRSFLLVGGTTSGNLAMILSTCEAGDLVFVQRNCHKSILHALQLARVEPVFLYPEIDESTQTPIGVSFETFKSAIKQYPDAKAVILTYPNYYGQALNIERLIDCAHAHNMRVLVDEAHGAHFIVGSPFPPSALSMGADIVVQSAHKTLPAMTMGSFLHVNSKRVDDKKLSFYLQVFQSSSPSYPIMASLDIARVYLQTFIEKDDKSNVLSQLSDFQQKIFVMGLEPVQSTDKLITQDPLKLILQASCNGYELQHALEREQVYVELADPLNVLCIFPLGNIPQKEELLLRFQRAMSSLTNKKNVKVNEVSKPISNPFVKLSYSYEEMNNKNKKRVPLSQASGYIAAQEVIPYPPGVALVMSGEKITDEQITQCFELKILGARFQNEETIWNDGILVIDE